jgi:peptidoglycan/LPS O-acetylase OafA/YrhL
VLDGWRTISVALVIMSHILLGSSVRISGHSSIAAKFYIPLLVGLGYVGVDVFFVISGFVICRGFMKEIELFHRISLPAFYVRRSFRILPPLAMYVATIVAISRLHVVDEGAQSTIRALTFTCNIPVGLCGGWLGGHTWSLSVEEQFYLIIPLIFSAASVHREPTLTSIAVILPALVLILHLSGQSEVAEFLSHFCAIGIGVACAINEQRLRTLAKKSPRWLFYAAMVGITASARLHNTRLWPVATVALALAIAYVLLVSMSRASFIERALCTRPMRAVGRASYGLYLWQQLATYPFDGAGVTFYSLSMVCCLAVVFASYIWIEQPLIKIGHDISCRFQSPLDHSRSPGRPA